MSPNRRIFLNIVATYGRSLYALILGLFTARWALQALGSVDYGLIGVIGSLTAFISYFNGILGSAIGRFYAISIGQEQIDNAKGLEDCRMWFTTAMIIHTFIPVCLILIGYPIGEYAVRHWLTVPADRIVASVWVWRFVCITCMISMVSVPWNAMYSAKQYIAELTVYSFAASTLNAAFVYYMVTNPGIWMTKYGLWQCLLGILPNTIIAVRAFYLFPECRVLKRHLNCWRNIRQLWSYAGWNAWGALGAMLRMQGSMVVINMFFGPVVNAAAAIGSSISTHCISLSGGMINAFSPAIYNAWGAERMETARNLSYRACKFGALLILIFAVPLILEIHEVLVIWLETPPKFAGGFCVFVLVMNIIDRVASGQQILVNAKGKIALYQAFLGTSQVLTLPIAVGLIYLGVGPYAVGWSMVATMGFNALGRAWFARHLVNMSVRHWIRSVVIPILIITLLSAGIGYVPRFFMSASVWRVLVTTVFVEVTLLPLVWFIALDCGERQYVGERFVKIVDRIKG